MHFLDEISHLLETKVLIPFILLLTLKLNYINYLTIHIIAIVEVEQNKKIKGSKSMLVVQVLSL